MRPNIKDVHEYSNALLRIRVFVALIRGWFSLLNETSTNNVGREPGGVGEE